MRFARAMAIAAVVVVLIGACRNPVGSADEEERGALTGNAYLRDAEDHSGIVVPVEAETEGVAASTALSLASGTIEPRSVIAQTTTGDDGSYTINDLAAGTYSVYASAQDSLEKAVRTSIEVPSGQSVSVDDLYLTPTGTVTGTVVLEGTGDGIGGVLVYRAGTSYIAITDGSGAFTMSDVPTCSQCRIVASGAEYQKLAVTVDIVSGEMTDAGAMTLSPALIPPSNAIVEANESGVVTISWSDNSLTEEGFQILRSGPPSGTLLPYASVGANVTTFSDTSIGEGLPYDYVVRAFSGDTYTPIGAGSTGVSVVTVRRIAYDSGGDIYLDSLADEAPLRLTASADAELDPSWSPNGTRIVYTANSSGSDDIWVMDANGGNAAPLTSDAAVDEAADWIDAYTQPRIAFVSHRDGNAEIYVMNPDGSDKTNITNTANVDETAVYATSTTIVFRADWHNSNDAGNNGIYSLPASGGGTGAPTLLFNSATADRPALAPDGTMLAYVDNGDIYVVDIAGGTPSGPASNITNSGAHADSRVTWSPDSSRIAYGDGTIYTARPDGSYVEQMTADGVVWHNPGW